MIDDLLNYYADLLILQFRDKPKAREHIKAIVKQLLPVNSKTGNLLINDIRNAFNVEDSKGVQQDVVGKYAGIDRYYTGFNTTNQKYFGCISYSNAIVGNQTGFANYSDYATKTTKSLKYNEVVSGTNKLSDDDYRLLTNLRIVQNNSNHSRKSIDESLYKFFGDTLSASSPGKMILDYFIPSDKKQIALIMRQKKVLPKPMGVRLNYIIPKVNKYLGFATYNLMPNNISGFSNYSDYDARQGESLIYNNLMEE